MTDDVQTFSALHVPGNHWFSTTSGTPAVRRRSRRGRARAGDRQLWLAEAFGAADGEKLPFTDVIANLERIVASVKVPVSLDIESGYGADPAAVRASVQAARDAGAVGINMEDRLPGETRPLALPEATRRVEAAAQMGLFVNARTDVFRQTELSDALVREAIERARAFADAGASGLFVPFLTDADAGERFARHLRFRSRHRKDELGPRESPRSASRA